MLLACHSDNDLYRALFGAGADIERRDSPGDAIASAARGETVLLLADEYPKPALYVDENMLAEAEAKKLRLYIEYPASFPGLELGEPRQARWERVCVASGFFAPGLEKGAILALHGCWYIPVLRDSCHMALAKVAGYREVVFGLPADAYPILFELPGRDIMIATSSLSRFVAGRYAPKAAWRTLWNTLLRRLCPEETIPKIDWTPSVVTTAGPRDSMPGDAEERAFNRAMVWFRGEAVYSIDQKKGVIEGFESGIDYMGRQMRRTWARDDCISESAMVFAFDWAINRNPDSRRLAGQMLDYVWFDPDFVQNDPQNPAYGLVNWYERGPVFYGDDNARAIIAGLTAGRLLDSGKWDEPILRCLLANFRTTGRNGFRRNSLRYPESFGEGRGWRTYFDEDFVIYAPHYQAHLWAAFLWGYALTGYEPLLERTRTAMRMTMDAWPNWRWTNGLTQELARMLLALAFLVRIKDTEEHRAWLSSAAGALLGQMKPSGAIHEMLGPSGLGAYPPPESNAAYGSGESSVIQKNGDPACDLLYTANFAFMGLREAACATGDETMREAENRLAEFLCRVQVRSREHPFIDGAWMRSFDDSLWEYWGSSSDLGWGAWCVESGWTNSWIAATLAMRIMDAALFDDSAADRFAGIFPRVRDEMMGPAA